MMDMNAAIEQEEIEARIKRVTGVNLTPAQHRVMHEWAARQPFRVYPYHELYAMVAGGDSLEVALGRFAE